MQHVQAKIPYRLPLAGGFTDFPEYYKVHGGETASCAIDRFITVSAAENEFGGLDIRSKPDLPWGVGLGSSGAYHCALVSILARWRRKTLPKLAVAKLAYQLETGIERHSSGRQDSLACLFKGFSRIIYPRCGSVKVDRIWIPDGSREKLNRRLLLFDTGERRSACDSIRDICSKDNRSLLNQIAKLPGNLAGALTRGEIDVLRTTLNLQEEYRSRLSPSCRSRRTDKLLNAARKCGAGARLTGAGVGWLLCYCAETHHRQLRKALDLPEITFSILW